MPRFVLLRHECPPTWEKPSHWDFMLEANGVLWTWELRDLPSAWATALGMEAAGDTPTVSATRLADHRLAYLDYEGPLSGRRGNVARLDAGSFRWLQQAPNQLEGSLEGKLLRGIFTLNSERDPWQLSVVRSP